MSLLMTNGPAVEPITVTDAKAHLRLDTNTEDILIASLILTSRLQIEAALGLALITQRWRLKLDEWPESGVVKIPLRPLQSVVAARVINAEHVFQELDLGSMRWNAEGAPPRLFKDRALWPKPATRNSGIEIDLLVGFGDTPESVPESIRHALRLLVAHWYEHRAPGEVGASQAMVPKPISDLLAPYQMVRI